MEKVGTDEEEFVLSSGDDNKKDKWSSESTKLRLPRKSKKASTGMEYFSGFFWSFLPSASYLKWGNPLNSHPLHTTKKGKSFLVSECCKKN